MFWKWNAFVNILNKLIVIRYDDFNYIYYFYSFSGNQYFYLKTY